MISRTMFIEAIMDCDMDYVVLIYGVVEEILLLVRPNKQDKELLILFWSYYYILHWIPVLVMWL